MTNRLNDGAVLDLAKNIAVHRGILTSAQADSLVGEDKISCVKIKSDGSTRRFWRICDKNERLFVVVAPDEQNQENLAEAVATWEIGNHLYQKNIPVPQLYGRNIDAGVLLLEDLGSLKLYNICTEKSSSNDPLSCENTLMQVIENLAFMQVEGVKGFDQNWCWETPVYDYSLMVEREAKYFLGAFWQDFLRQEESDDVLAELEDIAHQAQKAPAKYLLHRDFQSRNIMVKDDTPFFIDYQGARIGPLGYDLASLLIDPYTQLTFEVQEKMMNLYLEYVSRYQKIDMRSFSINYTFLAVQRNLQIIGAFAFLYKERNKTFFKQFLRPAVVSLRNQLDNQSLQVYKHLRLLVDNSLKLLD